MPTEDEVYLVQVTNESGEHRLWAAAMPGTLAVLAVLEAAPQEWRVSYVTRASQAETKALALTPGTVKEIAG